MRLTPSPTIRARASRALQAASLAGVDSYRAARSIRGLPAFLQDRRNFGVQQRATILPFREIELLPALADRYEQAGATTDHYFRQDLHVAKLIHDAAPHYHVDVGSRIDGFVAHLLVFRNVDVVDVRPLTTAVPGLTFVQSDATAMTGFKDESIESLSSLHAVEHFGLGRYGDPVDIDAPARALASFERVLAPGGHLYLSVPVGRRRIEFNAHRVFDPADPLDLLPTPLSVIVGVSADQSGFR